jgi:hypothetical protein
MTLSKRAEQYLATFERRAAPSADALRARLRQLELPELEPWLTFQVRYVLSSPRDEIVLGCLHEKSVWLPESGIDFEQDADAWFIACADAHPSYDYWIDQRGEFLGTGSGGPAVSFEKKLEQWSLLNSLGPEHRHVHNSDQSMLQELARAASIVEAASDAYSTWLVTAGWSCTKVSSPRPC